MAFPRTILLIILLGVVVRVGSPIAFAQGAQHAPPYSVDRTRAANERQAARLPRRAGRSDVTGGSGALRFVENLGQVRDEHGAPRPDVLYSAGARGVRVYLAKDRIHYVYARPYGVPGPAIGPNARPTQAGEGDSIGTPSSVMLCRVEMEFLGANRDARVEAFDPGSEIVRWYLGGSTDGARGARAYRTVIYHDLYPNIDLVLRPDGAGMKYDLVVRPGGNPNDVRIAYHGADTARLTARGGLHVANALGYLSEGRPYAYQDAGGRARRRVVRCAFHLRDGVLGFDVGGYDRSRTLVIDPAQEWATFYGGGGLPFFDLDYVLGGHVLDVDRSGNALLLGNTLSATFPASPGALRTALAGVIDAFLVKFDPYGNVVFATYYGGSNGDDYARCVAADADGNIFIAGETSSTDIPRASAFQNTFAGGVHDGFIAKISASGALLWGTYCGTAYWDAGYGLAVDAAKNVTLLLTTTGATLAAGTPVYKTPRNPAHPVGGGNGNNDLMVLKINGATGRPVWAKFIGGAAVEYGFAAASDPASDIVVTGWTNSADFPTTPGCAQAVLGGGYDAFVVRMDSAGATLWSTYYGGSGNECSGFFPIALIGDIGVSSVAADRRGNVFITGATNGGIPTTAGAWKRTALGGDDAYCVMYDTAGALRWATYLGTAGNDYGLGISTSDTASVGVIGTTNGVGLGTTGPGQDAPFQATYNGGVNDAFIVKLDNTGAPRWVTYFGGPNEEAGHGIAFDGHGALFIAGETDGTGATFMRRSRNQVANGRPLARPGNSGGFDAYISLFCDSDAPRVDSSGSHFLCDGDTLRLWIAPGYTNVKWYQKIPPTYATSAEIVAARGRDTLAVADSGRYYVAVESVAGCAGTSADIIVTKAPRSPLRIAPESPARLCLGDTIELAAGPGTFAQYRWERSPGVFETTPTMKVWRGGTYKLAVMNAYGCRDSAVIVVNESARPTPVTAARDTAICEGETAVLTASGGVGGRLDWYAVGNGTSLGATAQLTVDKAGTYYVVASNADGCSTRSGNATVRVYRKPRPKIQPMLPASFCEGDSTMLDAVPTGSGDAVLPGNEYAAYAWSTGETGRRIVVKDGPIGLRSVTVTVTDTNGCSATARIDVTKSARSKPRILRSGDTVMCEGDSLILSADSAYAAYRWTTGATDDRILVTRSGAYALTATPLSGCVGTSDTVHVIVHPRPVARISGPALVCLNSQQSYEVPAVGGLRYSWTLIGPAGAITSSAAVPKIDVAWTSGGTDLVIVSVTDPASGCVARDTLSVTVGNVLEPRITADRPLRLCPGDTVELDAGAGFTRYTWSTGAATRKIKVALPGGYTVNVRNAGGCAGTSPPAVVTLVDPIEPTIVPSRSVALCPGDTVVLDAGAGFREYLWNIGATVRLLRVAAAGTYFVSVVDSNGCRATSKPTSVTLNGMPTPVIAGPNSACINATSAFTAAVSSGSPGDTYSWSVRGAGGTVRSGQGTGAITVGWNASGEDTVEVVVTSALTGCTGRAFFFVTVGTSLVPAITTNTGATSFCPGGRITLRAPVGYAGYRWSPNGETADSITIAAPGTYTVAVRDVDGCTGTADITITERPPFKPTISASAPGFCPGETVQLTATPGYARYRWSPTGETTSSITVAAAGAYTVTATDAAGCDGASDPVSVVVYPVPVILGIDQVGYDLVLNIDETNGPAAAAVQWYMNGVAISGAGARRLATTLPGDYSVTVTSADGCAATFGPVRPAAAATSTIAAARVTAPPGDRVVVPIMLTASEYLDRNGASAFEARLRFNRTLLIPPPDSQGAIDGNDRVVAITGTRAANMTYGELARVEFTAALGDAESTPLVVEGFRWLDTTNGPVQVSTTPGTFTLQDLCTNGGTRLLAWGGATKINAARPNPTSGITEIEYAVAERGRTRLYVVDGRGTGVATLVDAELAPGVYRVAFEAHGLPVGAYTCVLAAPNERATYVLQVVR